MNDASPSEPMKEGKPEASPAAAKPETGATARSTGVVSIAILCSRVLGLVRDQMLNGFFGSAYTGIFTAAFRTPNMLRDLFAEGALSTAFVTTFSKKMKTEGDEAAWVLGRKMISLSMWFMTLVAIAGVALAPILFRILTPGLSEEAKVLGTWLAQIMYPFIALVSVTALVMGMLNSKKVFFIPAVASAFFNLGCIVGGVVLAWIIDPGFRHGHVTDKGLTGFAIGTLIGGVMQLGIQLPSLRRVGFRFRFDFGCKDPAVKEVLHLMWPSMLAASGTQVAVLLNSIFASYTDGHEKSLAWLANAQRLQQLPLGLFGVAVATVTLPMLSRLATDGITPAFRGALAKGLRLVLFLTLPCAVGLTLLSEEIISVIFEHGKFNASDVRNTAAPLQAYAFGLIFYAAIKVLQPAFYTINRRFIPMVVSIGVIVFTATVNSITVFVFHWDHTALAWATAVGLSLNFLTLYLCMRKFASGLETGPLMQSLGRLLVGIAAMSAICIAAKSSIMSDWAHLQFVLRCATLGISIAASAAAYFAVTKILKVEEAGEFLSLLGRRFGKK
ncbi:murein biosynthesis integral membrane protein MurJ [Prosthecobacter vanneervenii]|uniref:Probable lipid II flippase MurJ n=1 Tax=Prosthecobacter vanneervenii TaxID=48466 RepID=A0A7W8DM78_9BACT|nr:murein biosynthesis integral membrane protein MurJ [Prosthecobacter vanneervenii]MBB5034937.1 putative peptidoglycan lipid II flippase [Prosthecobacter vanneervenii]